MNTNTTATGPAPLIVLVLLLGLSPGLMTAEPAIVPVLPSVLPAELATILTRTTGVRTTPFKQTPCGQLPDGALLGNGDVGVVVAGTGVQQEFYIAKNDFWAPFDTYGYLRKDVPPSERGIGQLMFPIGGISVAIPALDQADARHESDLLRAESRSVFTAGNLTIRETARVVATDNLLLIEIENQGTVPGDMTITTWTRPNNLLRVKKEAGIPDTSTAGCDNGIMWIARDSATMPDDAWVTHGSIATRILGVDCRLETRERLRVGGTVTLRPGQRIVVASCVGNAVSFAADFKLSKVRELVIEGGGSLTASKAGISRLTLEAVRDHTARHRQWWERYWARSSIELPDEPLLERFYYGAVYLMGCSARAGKVPPGLFGPWVTVDRPTWSGDYHLDYNHEHPWYNVYAANHQDLALPYFDSVVNLLPLARETAQKMRQAGVLYRTCAGPYGWAHPGTHNMPNNAELAVNFRDYYDFTRDIDFLRQVSYPFMKEVALNWEDKLIREPLTSGKPEDYRYKIRLAWDESQKIHDNPTSGLAFCRALYQALVRSSATLEADPDLRHHWQDVVTHLSAYATTDYKGKTVFDYAEGVHNAEGNVYPYNTYPFYPAGTEGPDSPYRQILIDTIATRPSLWFQANAFTQVFAAAALGGYPADELLDQLRNRLRQVLEPNNIARVPGEICIENAFAINNVILLLLQSHGGCIRVFPCWNLAKPARFADLRARGAFLVSSQAAEGTVQYVNITSERGGVATILNPWPGQPLIVDEVGGGRVQTTRANESYSFPTRAGHQYHLRGNR